MCMGITCDVTGEPARLEADTRNRRLGPLVQHPPPHLALGGITPQQAENQHTTTRKEAASTSLHKTRDLTNNARAAAPVTGRDTRSEGVHCLRIGCTAPHDKHNCGQFLPTYPSGSIRRSHTTSKYLPGSEQEALHPIRRATPDQKGCTAYGSGAVLRITRTNAESVRR